MFRVIYIKACRQLNQNYNGTIAMTKRKKRSIFHIILVSILRTFDFLRLADNIYSLLKRESKLVLQRIVIITILSVIAALLLFSIWWCVLGLICIYLNTLKFNLAASFIIVCLLNIIALISVGIAISRAKKSTFFSFTYREIVKFKKESL